MNPVRKYHYNQLQIGAKFSYQGQTYKKLSTAYAINKNGEAKEFNAWCLVRRAKQ